MRLDKYLKVSRIIKRRTVAKEVVDLQRLTMGTLTLDEELKRGEWRRLTKEELEGLLESVQ